MSAREVNRAVSILLPDLAVEDIALVLMALDSLHLLGDFAGTAESYIERVQAAREMALREVTRQTLRLVEPLPPDGAA